MKEPHRRPKAVIFDMDGTITQPYLDFAWIKREIGCAEMPILEFLATLDPARRREARAKVDAWEREGAHASTLNPGVREVLAFLKREKIPTAILTRNTRESVDIVFAKHALSFDVVITADDELPPKPSPEPVRHIAKRLGLDARDVLLVGDFRFDIESGRAAGARTAFLRTSYDEDGGFGADYVIREMGELIPIIRGPLGGFP